MVSANCLESSSGGSAPSPESFDVLEWVGSSAADHFRSNLTEKSYKGAALISSRHERLFHADDADQAELEEEMTASLDAALQQIQHYTNQLAKETNRHLKELGSIPLASSPSEQRQQRIQRDRLMNDFSAALNNFQAVQRRAAEKERESIARARAGSCLSNEDSFRDEKLVSFDNQEDLGPIATQTEEMAITEEDLELIKERETNIRQLESDIMDVNQIFKDLAVMIHDHGEMIDSIEANVENAEVHVERGAEQLQRAAYYQFHVKV
ncbi:syntaxin-12 [Poecilia reticulata]|uniref:syntaxin-12 n=1 Tax=Poecilia reticulata TaxID=8081 RepID=UPI0007E95502|nr:PREDICTED: syntaxin-12 [Poecilia reticulata]